MLLGLINDAHTALVDFANDFVAEIVGDGAEFWHGTMLGTRAGKSRRAPGLGKQWPEPQFYWDFPLP
jgi:hypothetical protein